MKEELELKLQEDFPFMKQNRVESQHSIYRKWGCECSGGWFQIIHDLLQDITDKYAEDGISLDIVIEQLVKMEDDLSAIDEDMMQAWHLHSFYWQMMDVWSEVEQAKWLWRKWNRTKTNSDHTLIVNKMREVHNLCCIIRSDSYNSKGAKWELKVAEWELYDFFFWENTFKNNIDTVSKWFDERRYAINYAIICLVNTQTRKIEKAGTPYKTGRFMA